MKKEIRKKIVLLMLVTMLLPFQVAHGQWSTGKERISGLGLPTGDVANVLTNVMNWLLGIIGVLGVIGFAISGVMYLTAAGNEGLAEKAKKVMIWCIMGVVVALLGVVIINTIESVLQGSGGSGGTSRGYRL